MMKFGEEPIRRAREAMVIARGKSGPAHAVVPPAVDVAAIRKKTGLSPAKFARCYGFSCAAVLDRE